MQDFITAASARIGEVRDYKDQKYLCVSVEPYTRRDGTQTALLKWESQCAECGEPFSFKAPNRDKFEPNRRCQAHRKPGFVARATAQIKTEAQGEWRVR